MFDKDVTKDDLVGSGKLQLEFITKQASNIEYDKKLELFYFEGKEEKSAGFLNL